MISWETNVSWAFVIFFFPIKLVIECNHKLDKLGLNFRQRMGKVENSGTILPLRVFQYILKLHPVVEVGKRS